MRIRLLQFISFLLIATAFYAQETMFVDTTRQTVVQIEHVPVMVDGDTIFEVKTNIGPLTSQARAKQLQEFLDHYIKEKHFDFDTLNLISDEEQTIIQHGDEKIFIVTQKDAEIENTTHEALAMHIELAIKEAHEKYWNEKGWVDTAFGAGYSLILLIVMYFMIKLTNKIFKKVNRKIPGFIERKVQNGIKIKNLEMVSERQVELILITSVKWFERIFQVLLIYLGVVVLISIYPGAQRITDEIIGYLLKPIISFTKTTLAFIPNIFYIVVIIFIAKYVLRFIKFIAEEIEKGTLEVSGFHKEWIDPTYKIVRFLVFIITAVMIFPYLPGSDSPAFKGISIFLGVLFSLGSTSSISNLVAGIILTYMRPFRLGDRIKVGETEGIAMERNLLVTRIRTRKNIDVTIPNAIILNNHIYNYTRDNKKSPYIFHTSITIGYDIEWQKVHEALLKSAEGIEYVLKDPEPFILQKALQDYAVCYELNCYVSNTTVLESIESEIHKRIQDEFNKANIEIMSPAFTAIREGNSSTVPESYEHKNETPKFGLDIVGRLFK